MHSLIELLESAILQEGRVEDVLKKYSGKITPEVVNKFVEAQEKIQSGINNKYLDWMVKEFTQGGESDKIIDAVSIFHKNLSKLTTRVIYDTFMDYGTDETKYNKLLNNPKDINNYTLNELIEVGDELKKTKSGGQLDKEAQAGSRKIYDDGRFSIVVPLTVAASCKYGRGTKWCTAATRGTNHFISQTASGILFYVTDKSKAESLNDDRYKLAVLMNKDTGDVSVWDVKDKNISNTLKGIFTPPMIKAMSDYRQKYVVDFGNFGKEVIKMLASLPIAYNGWTLKSKGNTIYLDSPSGYIVAIDINLKNKNMTFNLMPKSASNESIGNQNIEIDPQLLKDIEDIFVEHNKDPQMIEEWVKKLGANINKKLKSIITKFEPIIIQNNVANAVEILLAKLPRQKNLNKPHNIDWDGGVATYTHLSESPFEIEKRPSDTNKKLLVKGEKKMLWGEPGAKDKEFTYLFRGQIDFATHEFIFTPIENYGQRDMDEFEDHTTKTYSEKIVDPMELAKQFVKFLLEEVKTVYPFE